MLLRDVPNTRLCGLLSRSVLSCVTQQHLVRIETRQFFAGNNIGSDQATPSANTNSATSIAAAPAMQIAA
jgi:hypothetical protein